MTGVACHTKMCASVIILIIYFMMNFYQAFVKTHSIDLKGILIQMHSSVVRCYAFYRKHGAAMFHHNRIQIK